MTSIKSVADRIDWLGSLKFLSVHVACLMCIWTGVSWIAVAVALLLYWVRMFGITAGFHRYFSHRAYKTSRAFQFFLATLGTSAAQMGPLWWAAHHRHHHRTSDQEGDIHSPITRSLFWAHAGWILSNRYTQTHYERIPDFAKYPELVFLNRYHWLVPMTLAVALFVLGEALDSWFPTLRTSGFQLVGWGFFVSTLVLYHGTFTINSLAHRIGRRRFQTTDSSKNSFLLSLITLGEGWHNNHHRFPHVEKQGLFWWEIDITHYVLKVLSWFRIVWEMKRNDLSEVRAMLRESEASKAAVSSSRA